MSNCCDSAERVAATAALFKALGDPTRLRMFLFLRASCCSVALDEAGGVRPMDGPTIGEVCCHVTGQDKQSSTISHHLRELRLAGLIETEKRGRYIVCTVNRKAVAEMELFLKQPVAGGKTGVEKP
jgi:ArsR family transcriptional regulator, arsenate/arsenite/antimonite-responsive transcriptional repressor